MAGQGTVRWGEVRHGKARVQQNELRFKNITRWGLARSGMDR